MFSRDCILVVSAGSDQSKQCGVKTAKNNYNVYFFAFGPDVTSCRHSCCATAVWPGHTVSAPQQKTDVRLHVLSFYTRAVGQGARGEKHMPTVIGLFC